MIKVARMLAEKSKGATCASHTFSRNCYRRKHHYLCLSNQKNLITYAVEIKGTGVVMKDGKAIPNATSNFSKPSNSNFLQQFIIPMALEQISN